MLSDHAQYIEKNQNCSIYFGGVCPHKSQLCRSVSEVMQVLWTEMGLRGGSHLDAATWESFMVQFIRRQAERDANLFVVAPSTPAQYFHVLRRQANLCLLYTSPSPRD